MRGSRGLGIAAVTALLLMTACAPAAPPAPHAGRAGEPRPSAVSGYEYEDFAVDDYAQAGCTTLVSDLNAAVPGLVTGSSVHRVLAEGAYTIRLVELRVDADAAPQPFSEEALLQNVLTRAVGVAAPVREWMVSGQPVRVVQDTVAGSPRVAFAWLRGDVLTLLSGTSPETMKAYADGLIRADLR